MPNIYSDKELQQHLYDLDFDLKAETFAAFLPNSIKIVYDFVDYFDRRLRSDITGIKEDTDKIAETYRVNLSRRSFYNIFPERFFHATYGSTPFIENMMTDYRNRKKEEEKTRKFFRPIENEFFEHRITSEKEENKIFKSLSGDELVSFLTGIWDVDKTFPKKMAAKLLKAIPFMHKISGDIPMIAKVLETIIGEEITLSQGTLTLDESVLLDTSPKYLGVNFATSMNQQTFLPKYTFIVNRISNPNNIENYLSDGNITGIMNFFLNYTLPFEADFEVAFTLAENQQPFMLTEEVYTGRLGISTTI